MPASPNTPEKIGKDFWLYQLGAAISIIGDSAASIALAWWILDKTGSAAVMSSILAPAMVVRIFLLPLLGPIGDRFPRKWLLFISDMWRGVLTLGIVALIAYDVFAIPFVVALYVLTALGSALFDATGGIIPQLVPPSRLQDAYRYSQGIHSTGSVLGGIVGGIIVTVVGVEGAFLLDAVSFFIAAIAAALIQANTRPAPLVRSAGNAVQVWVGDLKSGWKMLFNIPVLFWLCVVAMAMNFVTAPLAVILPVLAKEARDLPPWFLGALESSIGAGSILGAVALGKARKHLRGDVVMLAGIGMIGFGIAFLAWIPNVYLPMALMLWVGIGAAWANIPLGTQFSLATPDSYRGRIGSIMRFMCAGIAPLGVAIAGFLISAYGLTSTLICMGAMLMLLTPLLLFIPRFSEFMSSDPESAKTFFYRHYPLAFPAQVADEPVTEKK